MTIYVFTFIVGFLIGAAAMWCLTAWLSGHSEELWDDVENHERD